ncbi:MAG TPA: CSLREA domain-containing protein, partial [Vicinamibacterales bacterium]
MFKKFVFLIFVLFAGLLRAEAATYVVNTTADLPDLVPGDNQCIAAPGTLLQPALCTLRAAIMEANAHVGPDTITFNIPDTDPGCATQEWCTITLALLDLPPLVDDGTFINGLTQPDTNPGFVGAGLSGEVPGYYLNNPCANLASSLTGLEPRPAPLQFPKPDIAINANNAVNAMSIAGTASDITIRGLAIYNSTQHAILGDAGPGTDRLIDLMFIGVLPQEDDPSTILVNEQDPLALRNKETGVRQLSPGFMDVTRSYVGFNGQGGLDGFS